MFDEKFDVITFGSASRDIYLKSGAFRILKDQVNFKTGEGICLPFGSKIEVEDILFASGGGGTNAAATFGLQGFKTAFVGAVGSDVAGKEVLNDLKNYKIDTRFVVEKTERKTNHSVIFSENGLDRTIMVYRGASDDLSIKDIVLNKLKAKWFYFAPATSLLCDTLPEIIDFAKSNGIKIAMNPSRQQLKMSFNKIDILFLNQEEASLLTGIDFENENEIFKALDKICPGIAVMTKGGEGVVASDGKYFYSAQPDESRKIVDTTGAGDSLASGFLAEYMRSSNIEKSIQFGLANSAGNLSMLGAKTGLLKKGENFIAVPVLKQECTENNLCINK